MRENDIQQLLDRMAGRYNAGDASGVAQIFTEDAQLHSPCAPPAVGRAAIKALHLEWTAEPSQKSFQIIDWGSTGDMAWCLCRFAEGQHTGDGTSLIVLVPDGHGEWRVRSCCLFGDD